MRDSHTQALCDLGIVHVSCINQLQHKREKERRTHTLHSGWAVGECALKASLPRIHTPSNLALHCAAYYCTILCHKHAGTTATTCPAR
jgi:hypothetical protein